MLDSGGTGSVLFTYADKKDADVAIDCLKKYENFNIIVDSGAFSVWNSGKTMSRDDLLIYYKKIHAYRKDINFINLDVIPGKKGEKPSKKEAFEACKGSLDNYYFFKKHKINVLPVFHEDDDFDFLEIYKKETDYIAISPANDSSTKRRMVWLDKVYGNIRGDYKTHGLAATAIPIMQRYPFYSVDSINWKAVHIYGRTANNSFKGEHTSIFAKDKDMLYNMLIEEIAFYVQLQKDITKLWEKRGIKWHK